MTITDKHAKVRPLLRQLIIKEITIIATSKPRNGTVITTVNNQRSDDTMEIIMPMHLYAFISISCCLIHLNKYNIISQYNVYIIYKRWSKISKPYTTFVFNKSSKSNQVS